MKGKLTLGTVALALIALSVIGAGGAVALSQTNVSASDMPLNDTFAVDEDTELLRANAENLTADTATVEIYGIDSDGNETFITNGTLTTDEANGTYTDTYEYSSLNASKYPDYRIWVNSSGGADSIQLLKLQQVSSGSGGGYVSGDLLSQTVLTISGYALTGLHIVGLLLALLAVVGAVRQVM